MFCPDCGKQATNETLFCADCGAKILPISTTVSQNDPLDLTSNKPYHIGILLCAAVILVCAAFLPIYVAEPKNTPIGFFSALPRLQSYCGLVQGRILFVGNLVAVVFLAIAVIAAVIFVCKRNTRLTIPCFLAVMVVSVVHFFLFLITLPVMGNVSSGFFAIILAAVIGIVFSHACRHDRIADNPPPHCDRCDRPVRNDDTFCQHCGNHLTTRS